ncbi:CLUMA_CG018745, isoform A [Clunio marinus]|uniref:CLUMA_CG018745, isoform A n=1 Tax=Clunio marinus TaxID=568069 RepID=A0A1J1IZM4_9DIPT|nr:CLUMA_CG018745, isoform A [Clunio marinus]
MSGESKLEKYFGEGLTFQFMNRVVIKAIFRIENEKKLKWKKCFLTLTLSTLPFYTKLTLENIDGINGKLRISLVEDDTSFLV